MKSKTGEFFLPSESTPFEITVNMQRYLFALQYCKDKIVLDASCGAGLGTYLYSLAAKRVIAVDKNEDALKYAQQYPVDRGKVNYINIDIEKELLPDHEVCISLETIEHLKSPDFFLSQLKGKELIFSIPMNSLGISDFHKYDFKGIDDIKEMIERYYEAPDGYSIQDNKWVFSRVIKKTKK